MLYLDGAPVTDSKPKPPAKKGIAASVVAFLIGMLWAGVKYCFKNKVVGVIVLGLLITGFFWSFYPPRLVFFGGVDMGQLDFNSEFKTITVHAHLYPRRYFLTGLSNATKHKGEFEHKADKMVASWLSKHPEYELIPGTISSSQGDRESSWGRDVNRQNRRLQVTRSYSLRLKGSAPPPQ